LANGTLTAAQDDPRHHRLLSHKLGPLLTWTRPAIERSVGPFEPQVFDDFDTSRQELVSACREKLRTYTDGDLSEILTYIDSQSPDTHGWSRFLSGEINNHKRRVPPWYAGGWDHPDHRADFDYWTKMPRFDVGELTCLSVGISPDEYPWDRLFKMTTAKDRAQFWPSVEFLVRRFEQLHRTFDLSGRNRAVLPRDFIEWVAQFEFEVHPGFWEPLKKFHRLKLTPALPAGPTIKPDKREVDSIAQLFTAMAIDYLGYNPKQARSPTTKEIAELAASLGMTISEDTILKYLRIGAGFISEDWTPAKR
jgi:hypothetical protein